MEQRRPVSLRKIALALAFSLPVLLLPSSGSFTPEVRFTAAAGLLMALLWLTEAMPLGLTALLPLIIFPLSGIRSAERIAAPYANSAVFLFLGGFLIASCVERSGLHRRFAHSALDVVGTAPRRLVLAVLLVTAGLSMWISNTATTLLMTPIAVAIVRGSAASPGGGNERLGEATLLAVAFGASLGGVATPVGTPTNLIFFGAVRELFPSLAGSISFAQWMTFGVLYVALALPICWLLLVMMCRIGRGESVSVQQLGLQPPGPWNRQEKMTAALFTTTALLWIFRSDISLGAGLVVPGWSNLLPDPRAVNDATVAVVMALVGFLLPVGEGKRLIEWPEFRAIPWDVLILFGGGFALADALEASGFSKWAGDQLSFIGGWPVVASILVLCLAVTLLSEVASNVATATAMMPVTAAVAVAIGVHPFLLMVPAVLAASSGFMLPVATAPNTIVYGSGLVRVRQMAKAGALLDLVCGFLITALVLLVVPRVLGIDLHTPIAP